MICLRHTVLALGVKRIGLNYADDDNDDDNDDDVFRIR